MTVSNDAVNFSVESYTPSSNDAVGFELVLPSDSVDFEVSAYSALSNDAVDFSNKTSVQESSTVTVAGITGVIDGAGITPTVSVGASTKVSPPTPTAEASDSPTTERIPSASATASTGGVEAANSVATTVQRNETLATSSESGRTEPSAEVTSAGISTATTSTGRIAAGAVSTTAERTTASDSGITKSTSAVATTAAALVAGSVLPTSGTSIVGTTAKTRAIDRSAVTAGTALSTRTTGAATADAAATTTPTTALLTLADGAQAEAASVAVSSASLADASGSGTATTTPLFTKPTTVVNTDGAATGVTDVPITTSATSATAAVAVGTDTVAAASETAQAAAAKAAATAGATTLASGVLAAFGTASTTEGGSFTAASIPAVLATLTVTDSLLLTAATTTNTSSLSSASLPQTTVVPSTTSSFDDTGRGSDIATVQFGAVTAQTVASGRTTAAARTSATTRSTTVASAAGDEDASTTALGGVDAFDVAAAEATPQIDAELMLQLRPNAPVSTVLSAAATTAPTTNDSAICVATSNVNGVIGVGTDADGGASETATVGEATKFGAVAFGSAESGADTRLPVRSGLLELVDGAQADAAETALTVDSTTSAVADGDATTNTIPTVPSTIVGTDATAQASTDSEINRTLDLTTIGNATATESRQLSFLSAVVSNDIAVASALLPVLQQTINVKTVEGGLVLNAPEPLAVQTQTGFDIGATSTATVTTQTLVRSSLLTAVDLASIASVLQLQSGTVVDGAIALIIGSTPRPLHGKDSASYQVESNNLSYGQNDNGASYQVENNNLSYWQNDKVVYEE